MIDEKKLIESLRASLNTGRETFPIDLIIECIEEQEQIGEWIPCSERLPENEADAHDLDTNYQFIDDLVAAVFDETGVNLV